MKRIIIVLITLTTMLSAQMQVCVSILPQAFFVQKVAGDLVKIEVLVKPGSSPATYAPKPSQLKLISDASLYFTIGVAFEKNWLHRFSSINDKMKLIDTTKGIEKISMEGNHHEHHEHQHKGLDPHVWLDPILVASQVNIIANTLAKEDPKNAKIYFKNRENFIKELHTIDAEIKKILSNTKNREFIVFHPSFGYFAKRYGLKQIAIEKEGKEPSVKYIKKVIDFAKKHQIKRVFVAPQFSQKSAKQIAMQIDGTVKSINPLAQKWDENILDIAKSFVK
jgi:zinc transport system substrate-binding protein